MLKNRPPSLARSIVQTALALLVIAYGFWAYVFNNGFMLFRSMKLSPMVFAIVMLVVLAVCVWQLVLAIRQRHK